MRKTADIIVKFGVEEDALVALAMGLNADGYEVDIIEDGLIAQRFAPVTVRDSILAILREFAERTPIAFTEFVKLVRANKPVPTDANCVVDFLLDPAQLGPRSVKAAKSPLRQVDDEAPWPVHPWVREIVLKRVAGSGLDTVVLEDHEPDAEALAEAAP